MAEVVTSEEWLAEGGTVRRIRAAAYTTDKATLIGIIGGLLDLHQPDPEWEQPPRTCSVCGGTGLVHGPGGNGNWTDERCCCDHNHCEYCSSCCDPQTGELDCASQRGHDIDLIARALGVSVDGKD